MTPSPVVGQGRVDPESKGFTRSPLTHWREHSEETGHRGLREGSLNGTPAKE